MQAQKEDEDIAVCGRYLRRIAKSGENQSVSQACVL